MTKAHSSLGASSMARWSACPGSVRLIAGLNRPRESSSWAEKGLDAHAYAAMVLKGGASTSQHHVGREHEFDGRKFLVDDEIYEAVTVYVEYIHKLLHDHGGGDLSVEQRFDLSRVHPGCFGTADVTLWFRKVRLLIVVDYKHGAGVPVASENNSQLKYYGYGALTHSKLPAQRVRLVIVQPRCGGDPIREWEIDALDLLDFRGDLIRYAKATEAPDAPLAPGERQCRFCPAAAICPALRASALAVVGNKFDAIAGYDSAALAKALDSRPVVETWLRSINEFAYAEAVAGRCPPGYKLVQKRATRKYRSEGEAIEVLQTAGVSGSLMFEPRSLKSPAQLEKLVGKELLEPLVIAESSGTALVPEIDKRPAVKTGAAAAFGPVADDLVAQLPPFLKRAPAVADQ